MENTSPPTVEKKLDRVPLKIENKKSTGLMFDDCMLLHEYPGHPERPARLSGIMEELKDQNIYDACVNVPSREATEAEILSVHTNKVREKVLSSTEVTDPIHISGDTFVNKYSSKAAHVAAGGLIELTKLVLTGQIENGFAFVRPPGHHAEKDEIMGFCLFNNVAIAAEYARANHGIKRILIFDWDVHHGNGTQHIFEEDPDILYCSVHKGGMFYPGTGKVDEVGTGPGQGKTINVPFLKSGMNDQDYYAAFKYVFMPACKEFDPELVIISAGFDCAGGDPLGPMNLSTVGFEHMLSMLLTLAKGKVVCALEGGYDVKVSAKCAAACMKILLGCPITGPIKEKPSVYGFKDINLAVTFQAQFWNSIKEIENSKEWQVLKTEMQELEDEMIKEGKFQSSSPCETQ